MEKTINWIKKNRQKSVLILIAATTIIVIAQANSNSALKECVRNTYKTPSTVQFTEFRAKHVDTTEDTKFYEIFARTSRQDSYNEKLILKDVFEDTIGVNENNKCDYSLTLEAGVNKKIRDSLKGIDQLIDDFNRGQL